MNIHEKIKQPENRKLEFKQALPPKKNWLKTIVAFANGAGGELIIGVSDQERNIHDIQDPLLIEEKISSMIYDSIYPILSPYISIQNIDGKTILIIQILPGSAKPYFIKSLGIENGVFIRIGSSNRKATPEIIEQLRRQAIGISYELETDISKNENCLDKKCLDYFFDTIHQSYDKEILSKWKILGKNNGDYFPTMTGIILFGKADLDDYDHYSVRLTRFQGNTLTNISETKEYAIPLIDKTENICKDIIRFLKKESQLEGIRRIEQTIIPLFAIREVVINALAHRDYSIHGSTIKINIFDNRLEIISPGILSGNIDIADIGTGISECRNRAIVRIFRKLNLMEELGTGIARIFALFREKNLQKPVFYEQGQYFKAILYQEREFVDIKEKIHIIVHQSRGIQASKIAEHTNIHRNTVLKYLNELIREKKIIKTGSGKNIVYKVFSHSLPGM